MHMSWRLASRLSFIILALLVVIIVGLLGGIGIITSIVVLVIEAVLLWYVLRGKWAYFQG